MLSLLIQVFVSIHAPARGATSRSFLMCDPISFQSTRPRGARPAATATTIITPAVSIHAPARGATRGVGRVDLGKDCFNPRAREGRDHAAAETRRAQIRFNPRAREGRDLSAGRSRGVRQGVSIHAPARGATRQESCFRALNGSFNPRAREGRDGRHQQIDEADDVSIHAPARGATAQELRALSNVIVSIHAPARGATRDAHAPRHA